MKIKMLCKIYLNAILAGICIGIAGTVYLSVKNSSFGAVLFSFGLITILCYGFKLYTGAIGYLVNQGKKQFSYLADLFFIWAGNLTGTFLVGLLVRNSRIFANIEERVVSICHAKLNDSWSSVIYLSFFCGILMYVAVETYRQKETIHAIFRLCIVMMCVTVFILSGFEHCIANMFYFSAAGLWNINTLGTVLLMTLGNSAGGMLLPSADKLRQ